MTTQIDDMEDIGMSTMNMANEKLFELQKERIYKQILYCKEQTPFYQQKWEFELPDNLEDFTYSFFCKNIPVLEKESVRRESEAFIGRSVDMGSLIKETTSGTSGHPMTCYKSKMDKLCLSRGLWKQRKKIAPEISENSRWVRFYSFRRDGKNIITDDVYIRDNVLHLSLFDISDDKLRKYVEQMNLFRPEWLLGVPSAVYRLAKLLEKENLEIPSIKFIELAGEYVSDDNIEFISKAFCCTVGNQYGTREFWSICYGTNNKKMEIQLENSFVESIYNDEIDAEELVVTGLTSKAWSLVRYRIGDVATVYEEDGHFYVNLMGGRTTEYYKLSNGKVISPILFSVVSRRINESAGRRIVEQYQVKVEDSCKLLYYVVLGDKGNQEIMVAIKEKIKSLVGKDIEVDVLEVDSISLDPNTNKVKTIYRN